MASQESERTCAHVVGVIEVHVPRQESERTCVYMCGRDIYFFRLDFGTVPTTKITIL